MNTRIGIDSWFCLLRLLRRYRAWMMILLARKRVGTARWCRLMMVMMMTRLYCGCVTVHYYSGHFSVSRRPHLMKPKPTWAKLKTLFFSFSYFRLWLLLLLRFCSLDVSLSCFCKKNSTPISFCSPRHMNGFINLERKKKQSHVKEAIKMIQRSSYGVPAKANSSKHSRRTEVRARYNLGVSWFCV